MVKPVSIRQPRRKKSPPVLPASLNPEQRIPRTWLALLLGISVARTYQLQSEGKLPSPEITSPRCVRWRAGDVLDFMAARRPASAVEQLQALIAKAQQQNTCQAAFDRAAKRLEPNIIASALQRAHNASLAR